MSFEAPRPTNEPLKPAEFYNPITDPVKAVEKVIALSSREPTDVELFEVIADTFATIATAEFNAGIEDPDGLSALEWGDTDEVNFVTLQSDLVFVGYDQKPKDGEFEREEESFIEGYSSDEQSPGSISFERRTDGSVKVLSLVGPESDRIEYSISTAEKKKIIEALLQGLNSKAPIAA